MNLNNIGDKEKFIEDLYRRLSGLHDDLLDNTIFIDRTRIECSKMIESIIKWMDNYTNKENDLNG